MIVGANLAALLTAALAAVPTTEPFAPSVTVLLQGALERAETCRCLKVAREIRTSTQWRRLLGRTRQGRDECATVSCCYGEEYGKHTLITAEAWDRGKEHTGRCKNYPSADAVSTVVHKVIVHPAVSRPTAVAAVTSTTTTSTGILSDRRPLVASIAVGYWQGAAACAQSAVARKDGLGDSPVAFDALLNRIMLEIPQDQTRLRNYISAARRRSRLCRCARVASPVYTSRQWAKMDKGGDRAGTHPEVVGQCITAGCPSGKAYRRDVYITREAWLRGKEHSVACRRSPAIV
jgi:hypothetical protein